MGRIAAHELGHGVFQLVHTFDSKYGFARNALPENLMSYEWGAAGQGVVGCGA